MLRKQWRVSILLSLAFNVPVVYADQCRSISTGSFTDPSVWDCGCDPTACDTVIVAHPLTANIDLDIVGIVFRIEADGELISDRTLEIGSTFITNAGVLDAPYLRFYNPGELTNSGSVGGSSVITNKLVSYNYGSINGTDSLVIGWNSVFRNNGSLLTNVLYSLGTLYNNTAAFCNVLRTTQGLVNNGELHVIGIADLAGLTYVDGLLNADSVIIRNSGDVYGGIHCGSALLMGQDGGAGEFQVAASALIDTRDFWVASSYTLVGSGTICASGHTENHGSIISFLDICDATPTMTEPPYLDVNTGTIGPNVSFCEDPRCGTVGLSDQALTMNVRVFPSPVTDRLSVQLDGTEVRTVDLEIFDMLGQQVRVESGLPSSGFTLDRGNIKAGLYTMVIRDLNGRLLYIRTIPFAP